MIRLTYRRWFKDRSRATFAVCLALSGCAGHPARFADRLPVTEVHDDLPITEPQKSTFIKELYQADVYVRRALTNGLDPRRVPEALDVNAVDEVPRSSWFRGDGKSKYERDGAPRRPFEVIEQPAASETPDAITIRDSRGLTYELIHDAADRPGMRTGAAAIASRLLFGLGYHTPEVHIVTSHLGKRAAAMRWAPGIDLGPTPIALRRPDDPNDLLDHLERRTLRVLFQVTAWLDMRHLRPRHLRDVYRGKAGRGHVQHQLVGFDGALGVDNYADAVEFANDPDREDANFFLKMFSLGLSPKPPGLIPDTEFPSVGLIADKFRLRDWDMSPPFEPTDSLKPGDGFWIAKRLAMTGDGAIARAIDAGKLEAGPSRWIGKRLKRRRNAIIRAGFSETTPCDVLRIFEGTAKTPARIRFVDYEIFRGFTPVVQRRYRVRILRPDGSALRPARGLAATGGVGSIKIARSLLKEDYLVVELWSWFGRRRAPRPLQIHLIPDGKSVRVVGIRH